MEKDINVLLVEPGKAPRKVTVRNTKEGVAEVLGEGILETVIVQYQHGACATFLPLVMLCHEEDLDRAERDPARTGGLPGIALLCCVEGNDLVSLPPALQEKFLEHYAKSGDKMIMDGNFVSEHPESLAESRKTSPAQDKGRKRGNHK